MATLNGIVAILGGVVNVEVNKTFQLTPYLVVDMKLDASKQPSDFVYISSDPDTASVGTGTGLISGLVEGTTQITVIYMDEDGDTYSDLIDVFVRPEGWFPPEPPPPDPNYATAENILKDKIAFDINGEQIVGTAAVYVDGTTLYMPDGLVTLS